MAKSKWVGVADALPALVCLQHTEPRAGLGFLDSSAGQVRPTEYNVR